MFKRERFKPAQVFYRCNLYRIRLVWHYEAVRQAGVVELRVAGYHFRIRAFGIKDKDYIFVFLVICNHEGIELAVKRPVRVYIAGI